MVRSSSSWRFFGFGGLFILIVCAATVVLLVREEEQLQNAERTRRLLVEARMLRDVLSEHWPAADLGRVAGLLRALRADGVEVALASGDGATYIDSTGTGDAAALLAAPESRLALQTGSGTDRRAVGTEGRPYCLVAVRIGSADVLGVVWLAGPAWRLADHRAALLRQLGLAAGMAALATLVLAVVLAGYRRGVLRRVVTAARRLSAGDLSADVQLQGPPEFLHLASALNSLRQRLAGQVNLIDHQRRMLQALIDNLHEGVVVAGPEGRIALLNPAAVRLLSVRTGADGPRGLVGRPVESCIPQYAVQSLLSTRAAVSSPASVVPDDEPAGGPTPLEIDGPSGKVSLHLRVSELLLTDPEQGPTATGIGRVVVLTDVTALQRAVQVRSEFVANASHELRTPLATIRAAVEALLDMDLATAASAARQFIDRIDRHSARLEQMVADLLDLSRLEARRERFEPQTLQVRPVLDDLRARFTELLERKNLHWEARCDPPDAVTIQVSPYLLRLTLDNLVDNAIKFTDPGGHVTVTFCRTAEQAGFKVADDGCGIPPEEQERVFERFYQVERSRSGAERGTGLGLSIVRHAVHAMHGTVRLESTPGCGTRVAFLVPQPPA